MAQGAEVVYKLGNVMRGRREGGSALVLYDELN